jgi:hypothetical protein
VDQTDICFAATGPGSREMQHDPGKRIGLISGIGILW